MDILIFIQNQLTQKDLSLSNQITPSIAWKTSHFLLLVEFAKKNYLKEIRLKELETLLSTSRVALPKKNYKSRYKHSFKSISERIKKCKITRKKEDLTFYIQITPKILPTIKQTLENLKTSYRLGNGLKKA